MPTQIRECLACEKTFNPEDALKDKVSTEYQNQYCSKNCEDQFESYLKESAIQFEEHKVESARQGDINALIKHFANRKPDA